jgi:hypothetical protein
MFENLTWQPDRMLLDDLVFRLEPFQDQDWDLGENCFRFYKTKGLMDDYARLWSWKRDFQPTAMLELGIWDGGSTAMWFECFRPQKLVAVDIQSRADSPYFRQYVASKGLRDRIKTYWGTDQADRESLKAIVTREFSGPLDLVIDDASHLYEPTKASFETLFPLLRPGGLYIIEDWAWGHWEGFDVGPAGTELTQLIFELVEAAGSRSEALADLGVFRSFVVVERGEADLSGPHGFELEGQIYRRAANSTPGSDESLRSRLTAAESQLAATRSRLNWTRGALRAVAELNARVPAGETLVLVDDGQLDRSYFPHHVVLPFLERSGRHWGPPADDATAIAELQRMRQAGASYLAFAWPAFWWLEYYREFAQHVRAQFRCMLENDCLIVFDLRWPS